jgi:hypothetical protein
MSRPPRPYSGQSTTSAQLTPSGEMDYLPDEFHDFVERQRDLAAAELGMVSTGEESDFAATLMELSAMVAHVLGIYQHRYANEAFLRTAQSERSLVRHGRRLGYEPDPGVAATGFLALTARAPLSGKVKQGFALSSAPEGEKKAQDYETLAGIDVHYKHNELPIKARIEQEFELSDLSTFEIQGTGFELSVEDVVVIETDAGKLSTHILKSVQETGATTEVTVAPPLPNPLIKAGFRMYANPASRLHLFGWDSAPSAFPDSALAGGAFPQGAASEALVKYGYEVAGGDQVTSLYLARELDEPALPQPVVRFAGGPPSAFHVESEKSASVSFKKESTTKVDIVVVGANDKLENKELPVTVTTEISGTVTSLVLVDDNGIYQNRASQAIRTSLWLLHWQIAAPLVHERPSHEMAASKVALDGIIDGLAPGQLLLLSQHDRAAVPIFEIAELTSVGVQNGNTEIGWRVIEPVDNTHPWSLGELLIQGNVVRISHGKTTEEVLGDADGVTPFLRFPLKHAPLTYLPGPQGGEPALSVRVGGVLWTRVQDLRHSDADDRHYVLQRDEKGTTFVVFGDARNGAIPPSGKKHITAVYRVGLGRIGNASAGQVNRIKKAHPLIEDATNPRTIGGGTDPAGAGEVRTQATRFIKTFDRAVSVQDHADLALTFPGVARASAFWAPNNDVQGAGGREGVHVIVADSAGEALKTNAEIASFLDLRRDTQVPLWVKNPDIVDVTLGVYIEIDPAYLAERVEGAVREALHGDRKNAPGLFTFGGRTLGQPAFLSDIYKTITAVQGVVFAQITQFDRLPPPPGEWARLPPPGLRDAISVHPGAWLRLKPESFRFTLPKEAM